MRVYLAGAFGQWNRIMAYAAVQNVLLTFADPAQWRRALRELPKHPGRFHLMVDSGAFSIWESGQKLAFTDWLQWIPTFAQQVRPHVADLALVGFDVIPKWTSTHPDLSAARTAAEASYTNWRTAEDAGVRCIPTFHQYEPWDVLDRYVQGTDYVALSPRLKTTTPGALRWLREAWGHLAPTTRVHILGLASRAVLVEFPAYSVDSRGYMRYALQGGDDSWSAMELGIEKTLRDEQRATALWRLRGIEWSD